MSGSLAQQDALATVTSDEFFSGTLVTISSFMARNPWFDGTVVVIHDGLAQEYQSLLIASFENLVFWRPDTRLLRKIERLRGMHSDLSRRTKRFLSIETLRIRDFDRVLFCDSDILFLDSVSELFQIPGKVVAAGDRAHHRGFCRDQETFVEVRGEQGGSILPNTFNAGVILTRKVARCESVYCRALELMNPGRWGRLGTEHTDQFVWNLLFAGENEICDVSLNYLVQHHSEIYQLTGIPMSEARALHFNGRAKPWKLREVIAESARNPGVIHAFELWSRAFTESLRVIRLKERTAAGGYRGV